MVFPKESLLLPEISRVTFHTTAILWGSFFFFFVTDSWIWSYRLRKSPLAHKDPCIFCKAKLPRPGLLPLAPPHFLIVPGPLPGAFDFVFHPPGLG